MAKKSNNAAKGGKKAGKGNAPKATVSTIARKGAIKGVLNAARKAVAKALKRAEKTVKEGPKCMYVTLETNGEMQVDESRKGRLYRKGKYTCLFIEEDAKTHGIRPWSCQVKLAQEKPFASIKASADGSWLHVYMPKENIHSRKAMIENFIETTEKLCEQLEVNDVDVLGIIGELSALKTKMLSL